MSLRTSTSNPRRLAAAVAAVAAAGLTATTASAADLPLIETPLQTVAESPTVSVGEGHVAWTVPQAPPGTPGNGSAVWTLRDGAPTQITTVSGAGEYGPQVVDVGTNAEGIPLAVVESAPGGSSAATYSLVRLDSGAVSPLHVRRGGRILAGAAIDHGHLLYTLAAGKPTTRSTSTLWRASLSGTSVGHADRVRTSQHGQTFRDVLADRGRVAVTTDLPPKGRTSGNEIAFGTLHGTWRRTGRVETAGAPVPDVQATGFTSDGARLVTLTSGADVVPKATARAIPIGSGKTLTATFADSGRQVSTSAGFDPASGRLLVGTVAASIPSGITPSAVGWSPALPFFP